MTMEVTLSDDGSTSVLDPLEAELQQRAPRVLAHMNKDHGDSIKAYSMAFGEDPRCATETDRAILVGLDKDGFFLEVTLTDGTVIQNVRVPYQGKVKCGKDLHTEAVSMHWKAYNKLGVVYKVKSGYYRQVTRMVGFVAYQKAKKNPLAASAVAIGVFSVMLGAGMMALRRKPSPRHIKFPGGKFLNNGDRTFLG